MPLPDITRGMEKVYISPYSSLLLTSGDFICEFCGVFLPLDSEDQCKLSIELPSKLVLTWTQMN